MPGVGAAPDREAMAAVPGIGFLVQGSCPFLVRGIRNRQMRFPHLSDGLGKGGRYPRQQHPCIRRRQIGPLLGGCQTNGQSRNRQNYA